MNFQNVFATSKDLSHRARMIEFSRKRINELLAYKNAVQRLSTPHTGILAAIDALVLHERRHVRLLLLGNDTKIRASIIRGMALDYALTIEKLHIIRGKYEAAHKALS